MSEQPARPVPPDDDASGVEPFPPQGVKPQVGDRMQLRALADGANYVARLVGYIRGRTLIATLPKGARLREGDELEVRTLTGRHIFMFRTTITRVAHLPAPYLHLAYPRAVQRQRLRSSPWASMNLEVAARTADGREEPALLANLSGSGAQLVTERDLGKEGETLDLSFPVRVAELTERMNLKAVVRRARPVGQGGVMRYGVEFLEPGETDRLWLRAMVYARLAEGYVA